MSSDVKSSFGETPSCFSLSWRLDWRTFKKGKEQCPLMPSSHCRCIMIIQRHTTHPELSSGIAERQSMHRKAFQSSHFQAPPHFQHRLSIPNLLHVPCLWHTLHPSVSHDIHFTGLSAPLELWIGNFDKAGKYWGMAIEWISAFFDSANCRMIVKLYFPNRNFHCPLYSRPEHSFCILDSFLSLSHNFHFFKVLKSRALIFIVDTSIFSFFIFTSAYSLY